MRHQPAKHGVRGKPAANARAVAGGVKQRPRPTRESQQRCPFRRREPTRLSIRPRAAEHSRGKAAARGAIAPP